MADPLIDDINLPEEPAAFPDPQQTGTRELRPVATRTIVPSAVGSSAGSSECKRPRW